MLIVFTDRDGEVIAFPAERIIEVTAPSNGKGTTCVVYSTGDGDRGTVLTDEAFDVIVKRVNVFLPQRML